MKPAAHLFLDDLKEFSLKSILWCVSESEEASSKIATAIDVLLQDTERVSSLSKTSLDAINGLRADQNGELSQQMDQNSIQDLITGLKALCAEHDDVRDMIDPILKALQFQDRMKQNLDNLVKMLEEWLNYREKIVGQKDFTEDMEKEFAKGLYKCTTMVEERDLIKKIFPLSEQPKEGTTQSVSFF